MPPPRPEVHGCLSHNLGAPAPTSALPSVAHCCEPVTSVQVQKSTFAEDLSMEGRTGGAYAEATATCKATEVAAKRPDAHLIIAADTVCPLLLTAALVKAPAVLTGLACQ